MAPTRLGDYFAQQLDWTPDGSRLVFSGWVPGGDPESTAPQLFTMAADGTDVVALPLVVGGASWPRWPPDGAQLAFVAGTHLAVAAADGSERTILEPTGRDSAPL